MAAILSRGDVLTHWGRMTHICVIKVTIIGSDNALSPDRRQVIIWTNAGKWLIGPLGTKFSEILIEIHTFSFKKIHLKMTSGKWRPFCLGLNVLIGVTKPWDTHTTSMSAVRSDGTFHVNVGSFLALVEECVTVSASLRHVSARVFDGWFEKVPMGTSEPTSCTCIMRPWKEFPEMVTETEEKYIIGFKHSANFDQERGRKITITYIFPKRSLPRPQCFSISVSYR